MEPKSIKDTVYLPYLDGLRAIAAIYVILHHTVYQFHFNYQALTTVEKYSIICFFQGHFAVNFFIVLSGFCLTIPLIRKKSFTLNGGAFLFYKKRIKRIVIPYYFALGLSLLLIAFVIGLKTGRQWDSSLPVSSRDIITHLLLVQDVFSNSMFKISHPLWTISVEFRIYLFFPLLLWIWRKFGAWLTLLSTVLISAVILVVATFTNRLFNLGIEQGLDGVNPYIILFSLGMLAAHISLSTDTLALKIRTKFPWLIACIVLLGLVLVLQRWMMHVNWPYSFEFLDVLFGFWSLTLLILINGDKIPLLKRVLSLRPLVGVGMFSYSIYLIHAPLIQVIWQYAIMPFKLTEIASYYLMVLIGTPLIIVVSYLFYLAFEKPFMNHKKKFKKLSKSNVIGADNR
jgi:peptidoglycan/LPS O-acetylase OafA/YrhL